MNRYYYIFIFLFYILIQDLLVINNINFSFLKNIINKNETIAKTDIPLNIDQADDSLLVMMDFTAIKNQKEDPQDSTHLKQFGFQTNQELSFTPQEIEEQKKSEEAMKARESNDFVSVGIRHLEGRGIGYKKGYSTFEALFFPKLRFINWSMFLDLRLHYFNNAVYASNTGLGFRYFTPSRENVFGFNIYYDFRDTKNDFHVSQIGFGGEILRERFDARLNAYFPLSNKKFLSSDSKDFSGGFVLREDDFESTMKSVFFEGGYWIEKSEMVSVYGAVGQYYLHKNKCTKGFGGNTRIKIEFKKYLSLEGRLSYDSLFNMRGQGIISLRFPLGEANIKKSKKPLFQTVHRNDIIPLAKTKQFEWNW